MKNKKIILMLIFFLGVIITFSFWASIHFKLVETGGRVFLAERALTLSARELGLGGRKELGWDRAMLFEFENAKEYPFWMKGMLFDLDILWISDQKAVWISRDVSKDFRGTIRPNVAAVYVLEVPAGTCDKLGLKVGDETKIYPFISGRLWQWLIQKK